MASPGLQQRPSYAQLLGGGPPCRQPPDHNILSRQIAAINKHTNSLKKRVKAIEITLRESALMLQEAAHVSALARAQLPALEAAFKTAIESKKMDTLREQLDRARDKLQRHLEKTATASTSRSRARQAEFESRAHEREQELQKACENIVDTIGEEKLLIDKLKSDLQKQRFLAGTEEVVARRARIPALVQEKEKKLLKIEALEDEKVKARAAFLAAKAEFKVKEKEWIEEKTLKDAESVKTKAEIEHKERMKEEEERKRTTSKQKNTKNTENNDIDLCDQLISIMQEELNYMLSRYRLDCVDFRPNSADKSRHKDAYTNSIEINAKADANSETDSMEEGWIDIRRKKNASASMPPNVVIQQQLYRRKIGYKLLQTVLPSFEKLHISPPMVYGDISSKIDILRAKKAILSQKQTNVVLTRSASGDASSGALKNTQLKSQDAGSDKQENMYRGDAKEEVDICNYKKAYSGNDYHEGEHEYKQDNDETEHVDSSTTAPIKS